MVEFQPWSFVLRSSLCLILVVISVGLCASFCSPLYFRFCFFFICVIFVSSSLLVSSMIRRVRFLFLFLFSFFLFSGMWLRSIKFVSDCGLFATLCLRRRLILFFISGIVVLKHGPTREFSFCRYFLMFLSLLSFVHLQVYSAALSLSLDLLTATTQCHAEFASSEPDSTPNTPAEGCVESSSLSSLSARLRCLLIFFGFLCV